MKRYRGWPAVCPARCNDTGPNPSAWTYYHDFNALVNCNATVLFELNVYNSVDDSDTHLSFRACTADGQESDFTDDHTGEFARRQVLAFNSTIGENANAQVKLLSLSSATSAHVADAALAAGQLGDYVRSNAHYTQILFAKSKTVIAGLYSGSQIQAGSASSVVQKFTNVIKSQKSVPQRQAIQACGTEMQKIAPQFFGLVVDTAGNVSFVQEALKGWNDAKCLSGAATELLSDTSVSLIPAKEVSVTPFTRRALDSLLGLDSTITPRATCTYIQAQSGDGCFSLAQRCDITQAQLESYNGGASFCNKAIQLNQYDFCTPDPASTGAPGTAQPGSNGCISNCGTDIVTGSAVANFARIGYYEAFGYSRACLHMSPSEIPSTYTHVHFAFANITADYAVDVSEYSNIFDAFAQTSGFKKILSFGGWGFSTGPQTYPIFRSGVTPAQRQTFANNVAAFIQQYSLDGVDFDWEYPGAPDIPGIPPGSPDDGANYLAFLKLVRAALPSDYSVSLTAPASFWYLKGFPIAEMSKVVDYIVYMTYDLHGQWDYGNSFSDPGCPAGNCLRSQINHTETAQAFSMITKAGVPINMLMLGQPLYGRAFQMTEAGCYSEMCTYTGPASGALPGKCTGTAGYISNWEINQIISNSTYASQQYYSVDAGDILVYDSTQWVSWMKPSTYNSRSAWAQALGFGGIADWAVDLNASYTSNGTEIGEGSGVVYIPPSIYNETSPTVACSPPCTFVFPPWTLSTMTTISQPPVTMTVEDIWPSVSTDDGGVTTTVYVSKTVVTTISIPPVITDTISLWNVEWTDTDVNTIYLSSSIVFPGVTLTEPPDTVTTSSSTTVLAGVIYTYSPGPYPIYTGSSPGQTTTPIPPPPPPGSVGHVHVSVGPPSPQCFPGEIGCGGLCLLNCGAGIGCIGICGCIGLFCPDGSNCIGPGCGGEGSSEPTGTNRPTSCEKSTTVTDCQVACSLTLASGGSEYSTDCYTTTCQEHVGCDIRATTTTSETTIGCPTLPPYSAWWTATDEPLPLMGDGAGGGSVVVTGTFTQPSTPITPVQSSSSKNSSSKTSSSATSSSSSSSPPPPPPPPNTGELCLGLLTAATSEFATYAYITFNPGDPCSGTYVTDGNIGSAEQVCDIPDNHKTVSLCAGTGTFENEGPQFFSGPSCGFALSLNGQLYETAQKVSYDDSRCSGVCPDLVASVQGILLFTGLPAC
ncbi:hypothetical protein ACHAPV_008378 [Trichoderma viride]